jgi:hypothetical protein
LQVAGGENRLVAVLGGANLQEIQICRNKAEDAT